MKNRNVAIIGAGPYGLSIAAHLKARNVDFRIFGSPMDTWMTQMPKGMRLKSEGFASSLYDPGSSFTLRHYCQEHDIPYADIGLPVPLETFTAYGLEFQKRFVPGLENNIVISVEKAARGFHIGLQDGEVFSADRVVVAVGICHFGYMPAVLAALPKELVTHSSEHSDMDRFNGRQVAVVGAGASALDVAALLHHAGASVQLIARKPAIRFHDPPSKTPPTLSMRLRHPMTGIGPGWKLFFCANAPGAFHYLPVGYRVESVKKILGPAPGWFIKEQVVGKLPFHLAVDIAKAREEHGRIHLELTNGHDTRESIVADHVIAATGYRVSLKRLKFLDSELRTRIRSVEGSPILSSNFESSVPGLYFVGTSAANDFGPVMRFAFGARYTAGHLSGHLARVTRI